MEEFAAVKGHKNKKIGEGWERLLSSFQGVAIEGNGLVNILRPKNRIIGGTVEIILIESSIYKN